MESRERDYLRRLIFKFEKDLRDLPNYSIYAQVVESVLDDIPPLSNDEIDDKADEILAELPKENDNPFVAWMREILEAYKEIRKKGKANLN